MSTVSANEVYVNNTGNDTTGNGSPENPYLTIQKGINSTQDNGTLIIAKGTYSGINNTNITIDKNMTITGESQEETIINGGNLNRIFIISSGVNVNICNLTFINGNNTIGGAIYNQGNLTVNKCIFSNNTAGWNGTNTNYGGVINNQGYLTVNSSIFYNNTARVGGAIYNGPKFALNINNCTFTNNEGKLGGVIYSQGTSIIKNSNFTNNTAQRGGVADQLTSELLLIDSCTFTDNKATISGGVIYNNLGNVTATRSSFTGNTVNGTSGRGGAIYNDEILNVIECTFKSNSAISGGAIYSWKSLTVDNCNFLDNRAENGGAICSNYSKYWASKLLMITGSNFIGNTASGDGGAIYNMANGTVHFCRIVDNHALNGSAIYCNNGSVDAIYNWWGSNSGPGDSLSGNVTYDPWIVMKLDPTKAIINGGTKTTLTANFLYDSNGAYHDPANGHIPDGTPVTFKTSLGQVGSQTITKYTVNGIATAILKAWDAAGDSVSGTAYISATTDAQTITGKISIIPVNAANTVTMQESGIQLQLLVLALLMLFCGWVAPKRK